MNQFFSLIISTILILSFLPKFSSSTWNFSNVNLPDDVPIWRFAIWRTRTFFAIPNFLKREKNIDTNLTLLEASWPEPGNNNTGIFGPTIVNNAVSVFRKFHKNKVTSECESLSSVVGLDVEARGRLWILDSSDENDCPAKIIIYDIRRNDIEIIRGNLNGVAKNNLKTLVIDPLVGIWGPRAYIGDPGDETIIVYSLWQKRWWRLRLIRHNDMPRIVSTDIAVSQKNSLIYLTDPESQALFSVDIRDSRNDEGPPVVLNTDLGQNCTVKWLGSKMGCSSGLAYDHRDGLHYFLVTEHASVRWDTRNVLKAESYSISLQTEQVPCITDYRVDLMRNIWGLVNLEHPFAKSPSSIFQGKWNATFRTVRIYKGPLSS